MATILSDTACSLDFQISTDSGNIQSVSVDVFDEESVLLFQIPTAILNPGTLNFNVMIGADKNTVADGEIYSARRVVASMNFENGIVQVQSQVYLIERLEKLLIGANSFLTYEQALIMAAQTPTTPAWSGSPELRRISALSEAFERICLLPMRVVPRDTDTGELQEEDARVISRDMWSEIDADAFTLFPTHFKRALRRAQFIEADSILSGEPMLSKARAGVTSETIGESSITLSGGKIDIGISDAAIAALTGYLYFNAMIERV